MPSTRPDTRFDILRHGEPDGEDCFRGSGVDHPLTRLGWSQMQAAIAQDTQWDLIISSSLSRCLDFAKKLSEGDLTQHIDIISNDEIGDLAIESFAASLTHTNPDQMLALCHQGNF